MFDFDKWPLPLQWAFGIGAALGGLMMAWFGARAARTKQIDNGYTARDTELERLRDDARDSAIKQECIFMVAQAKDAMGVALSATRQSFYGEFRALRTEIDQRLRVVENTAAALKAEVEELQRRRPMR